VLLTGQQPFQGPGITASERERRILEWTPDAPSTVARHDDQAGTAHDRAAARGATPASLARALRGDLDVIVQHAMAKRLADRYPTADALRDDLERHLVHRPILARPPAALYRIGRWLRRNARIAVPTVLALAFGITYLVATVQHARRLEREIAISRAVRDYVLSMFQVADPGLANGRPTTGAEMLDRGAREAMSQLSSQPSVQTEILSLLAQVQLARWEPAKALPLAERALQVQRTVADGEPGSLEEATFALGLSYFYVSRHSDAEALVRESLALRERRLGPGAGATLNTHLLLTAVLHHRGEIEAARASGLRLIEIAGRDPAANAGALAYGWHELADIERDAGRFPQALEYYGRVVATGDVSAMTEGDFGRCLMLVGRLGEARERIERGLAMDEPKFGPAHMFSAIHRRNRALLAQAEGRPHDAIAGLEGALDVYDLRVGLTSSYAAQIRVDLAFALLAQARHAEAAEALAVARDVLRGTRDGGHPALGAVEAGLGIAAWQAGDATKAREHLAAALALRRRDFGAEHPYTLVISEAMDTVAGTPARRAGADAADWFEVRRIRAALNAHPLHPL
jgi:serine/threonine-protein kinase